MENLQQEITDLLTNKLQNKFVFGVVEGSCFNEKYLKIWIACSDVNINNVRGQKPQVVSLNLDLKTLELRPQIFGGNGGRSIYRNPNLNDPKEKYLAMQSVKIPFRKPAPTPEKVKECILKFVDNYIKALRENRAVLRYQDIVNYDEIL